MILHICVEHPYDSHDPIDARVFRTLDAALQWLRWERYGWTSEDEATPADLTVGDPETMADGRKVITIEDEDGKQVATITVLEFEP